MPGNIQLYLLSHSEGTTQEDFSTGIYRIYKPNKRKRQKQAKDLHVETKKNKELKIGNLSLLIPKTNFTL